MPGVFCERLWLKRQSRSPTNQKVCGLIPAYLSVFGQDPKPYLPPDESVVCAIEKHPVYQIARHSVNVTCDIKHFERSIRLVKRHINVVYLPF